MGLSFRCAQPARLCLVPGGDGPSGEVTGLSQRFCTVDFCDQSRENCKKSGQEKKRREARERMARTEKGGFQ